MAPHLRTRNQQAELMDDPGLDQNEHRDALAGLRRINWWSRTEKHVWQAIRGVAGSTASSPPLTILDIASGGGDLAIRLAKSAAREGIAVQITGCDISPVAIDYAQRQADVAGLKNLAFCHCNALKEQFPAPQYDVVMCSLFLHHLNADEGKILLSRMKASATKLVLVDDLRRTRFGYWLAWLGCRILTRCRVVHVDGPMSVEGALTSAEALELAGQAGLSSAKIQHHWPERFLLTWSPSGGSHA